MARESTFTNMVVVLTIITLVAAAILGGVYGLTKDIIAQGLVNKINSAIAEVVPEFDNDPSAEKIEKEVDGGVLVLYPAKKGGTTVGTAIETFTKNGFSGEIKLMVGFLPDGKINDIAVISHNETPGLGDKIEKKKSNFSVQFEGKDPKTANLTVKQDGGTVDAITASTISSRAYCDAIDRAYKLFSEEVLGAAYEGTSGATSATGGDTQTTEGDASSGATATSDTTSQGDATTGATTETDTTTNK